MEFSSDKCFLCHFASENTGHTQPISMPKQSCKVIIFFYQQLVKINNAFLKRQFYFICRWTSSHNQAKAMGIVWCADWEVWVGPSGRGRIHQLSNSNARVWSSPACHSWGVLESSMAGWELITFARSAIWLADGTAGTRLTTHRDTPLRYSERHLPEPFFMHSGCTECYIQFTSGIDSSKYAFCA